MTEQLDLSSTQEMLGHEIWYTEEEEVIVEDEEEEEEEEQEEEEEEESSSSESSLEDLPAELEESPYKDFQRRQELPVYHPLPWSPLRLRRCRRRLFAPYDLQEHKRDSEAEAHPWGRESPPRDPPVRSWVRDTRAVCENHWRLQQAASSRTLSHPSFQTLFSVVSTSFGSCPLSAGGQMGPQTSGGPLPLLDCSAFYYTDPMLPPGYRIHNCLSASSQEVLRSLPLNTPAPILCPRSATSSGPRWLSDGEIRAVCALLALSARSCPDPGSVARGEPGTQALSQ